MIENVELKKVISPFHIGKMIPTFGAGCLLTPRGDSLTFGTGLLMSSNQPPLIIRPAFTRPQIISYFSQKKLDV